MHLFSRLSLMTLFSAGIILSNSAQAYYSVLQTGEVLGKGEYQAMASPQVIFNQFSGLNFAGRLDTGLAEGLSGRAVLGFGKVDFQLGGLVKWVPFPDLESQPAIGAEAGVILARIGGLNQYSLRIHPLISKRIETEIGDVTPYGALPLGLTVESGDRTESFVPIQLVGGAELKPLNTKNWSFIAEVGLNVQRSFSFISGGVMYRFDDSVFGLKGR